MTRHLGNHGGHDNTHKRERSERQGRDGNVDGVGMTTARDNNSTDSHTHTHAHTHTGDQCAARAHDNDAVSATGVTTCHVDDEDTQPRWGDCTNTVMALAMAPPTVGKHEHDSSDGD
eukprot:15437647-Alexandrium_andersonii.AAC.1